MHWKLLPATIFATATLCACVCVVPTLTCAETIVCNQIGDKLIGASSDGKRTYFSSWTTLSSQPAMTVPQFFVVKVSNGKSKQLINRDNGNPRNRMIIPAPCEDAKWSPDHLRIVFCNRNPYYRLGVWMYTLPKKGDYLVSAEWIDRGSSPQWTAEGNLTYRNEEGKITTFPIPRK